MMNTFEPYKLESEEEVIVMVLQFLVHNLLTSWYKSTECKDSLGVLC